jgi:hypothetical protein
MLLRVVTPRPRGRRRRRARRRAVKPHRAFDPRRIGALETEAWVTYYRHEWFSFLRAAVSLTRHTFGLPWPQTLYGAWLVLRANQLWAPVPDNDPDGARRAMAKFYGLVARRYHEQLDPARAATLEVEWWRVHREHQRGTDSEHRPGPDAAERILDEERALVDALAALYAYTYATDAEVVRVAAEQRALAMRYSDQWVTDGCDIDSPLIPREREALVRSYAGLLAAVYRS